MCREIRIEGEIAIIPLTKGYEAVVDASDAAMVDGRNWQASETFRADGTLRTVYAVTGRGARRVLMHRMIMGASDHAVEIDHQDGNGLNNRRSTNLRRASTSQNAKNQGIPCNNKSGVKGVIWNKARQKWQAQIRHHGHLNYLGLFDDIETASTAYDAAALNLFGDFARTNAQEARHV